MRNGRMRAKSSESWKERFPRYAHNAGVTAEYADRYAVTQHRSADLNKDAASNVLAHGDEVAARLYSEMAEASLDAAEALEDIAALARKVQEHYNGGM